MKSAAAQLPRRAMPPKLTKTQVKTSASLLFNNLAANGKHVAFVHGSDVVIVGDAAIAFGDASRSLAKVSDKDSVVHQVRWVEFGADEFLCIASQRGLQLYTADGKRVLHSHPPPPGTWAWCDRSPAPPHGAPAAARPRQERGLVGV